MGLDQIKVELLDVWGGDKASAHAAWASSYERELAEAKGDEDVQRIVSQMVRERHDTPKERTWAEFFITCPIFVERQLDKYRMSLQSQQFELTWEVGEFGRYGITQNELSGRYRTIPDRPYRLPRDVSKILNTHQMNPIDFDGELARQHQKYQATLAELKQLERDGEILNSEYKRCREVLRGLLGTAFLTDMRLVLNMNAFEHIVCQRLAPAAQLESRAIAAQMVRCLESRMPMLIKEMLAVHGWRPWLEEVERAVEEDPEK